MWLIPEEGLVTPRQDGAKTRPSGSKRIHGSLKRVYSVPTSMMFSRA